MSEPSRVYDTILAVLDMVNTSPGSPIDDNGNLTDEANQSDWSEGYTMGWEALREMVKDAVAQTMSAPVTA